VPQRCRCELGHSEHLSSIVGIEIRQGGAVSAGHDEHMAGSHGLNVHERHASLVLINDARLKFPSDQTAKDAVIRGLHTCDPTVTDLAVEPIRRLDERAVA
jgi:hypothetical protein